jgi:hypothetical protein
MKSRELFTTPVLIVTNYKIAPLPGGKFLHCFTPESTSTLYEFEANKEPLLEEGERYNIGYTEDNGRNWVDISATAKAEEVDPQKSHYVARVLGEELRVTETEKSNARVVHKATDGLYLGKKYAWRIFGMAIPREVFDIYLDHIQHPSTPCFTEGSASTAYREDGLEQAMNQLIASVVKIKGNRFTSHYVPSKSWFTIKGVKAITDKK